MSESEGNPTPFTAVIKEAGGSEAFWIEWNDLQIPIVVGDYMAELEAGRAAVSMVDTSGLQKLKISGADAGKFLDYLCVRPMSQLAAGRVAYAAMTTADGYLRDDITIFRHDDGSYLVASGTNLLEWCNSHRSGHDVSIEDVSRDWCTLSVFGPQSYAFLKSAGLDRLSDLKAFHFVEESVAGKTFFASRTGFSGGLGYELWIPWDDGSAVCEHLAKLDTPVAPRFSGVGALDILRTEAGYLMPGHDFPLPGVGEAAANSDYRTPYEVGLGWIVKLDRDEFIGQAALRAASKSPRMSLFAVELEIDAEVESLGGTPLFAEDGAELGAMFNGGFSLTFGKYIGMCCLPTGVASEDMAIIAGDEKWPGVLKSSPLLVSKERTMTPPPV